MDERPIIERDAVRAIIVTPEREVLLMRVRPPRRTQTFWITPGGGIDPHETELDCLRRELREELGVEHFTLGPLVWRRCHEFDWDHARVRQRERYHVVELAKFEPVITDPVESRTLECFRWWTQEELAATQEALTPRALAKIVADYLRDGPPQGPIEVELDV